MSGCPPRCSSDEGDAGLETDTGSATDTTTGIAGDSETDAGFTPEAPKLDLSLSAIKQFDFTWAPTQGAEFYQLFEQSDPTADFVQVGDDIVGAGVSLTVPLHFRVNASYRLQACNTVGCSTSPVVSVEGSLAKAVGYIKAFNTSAGDEFGQVVAFSADGSTLAVGAWGEDSGATGVGGDSTNDYVPNAGAVYVFARNQTGSWGQQAYVKASNTNTEDMFGWSLALSGDGDVLAVSARWEDSNAVGIDGNQANDIAEDAGAVYVFERDAMNGWAQQAYIKASNTNAGDFFGDSVALSADGTTLAVGAHWERSSATGIGGNQIDNSMTGAGAVYVYQRGAMTGWMQQAYVKSSNTAAFNLFGWSVALSGEGDTLAVGAPGEDSSATGIDGDGNDDLAEDAGAVYVFERDAVAGWAQQSYVKASNTDAYDSFGWSVALSSSGDTLVVGASDEASRATGIDGDQADNTASYAGAVYVYQRDVVSGWTQQAYVKASNTDPEDFFGDSLALSADGNTLAVGAYWEASNAVGLDGNQADHSAVYAGAAYVYQRDALVGWQQRAYVKAANTGPGDVFGSSVALAGDGNMLVVGAPLEASEATGLGGDQGNDAAPDAGAVYLY